MTRIKSFLNSKRGLSTAVSSLIILVVSVLLATVVTYYAINVTSVRVEEEAVYMQKVHIWVNSSYSLGAFAITNTGGKDILVDKISVRGGESDWGDVYYWKANETVTSDLLITNATALDTSTENIEYNTGKTRSFTKATADIPVASGATMVFYFKSPDSVTVNDIGSTVSVTVYTVQAEYLEECNVESATPNS